MKQDYTIIVNSCDSYEDLWSPFFTLFKKYWPSCDKRIILNTETKSFSFDGINVETFSLFKDNPNATWSERFLKHLELTDTDFILVLLDDFFFEKDVDVKRLSECFELMKSNKKIACFHFLPMLWEDIESDICPQDFELRPKKCEYKVSVQAALWRKDILYKLIRKHESVWEFENFGSIRAHKLNDMFFTAKLHQPTVFTYDWIQGGAVHHGKWTCHMKDLLAKENIKIDFEKRGFDTDYVEPIETPSKNQVYSPRVSVIFKTLFSDRKLFAKKVKDRLHFLFSNRKSLK